MKIDQGAEHLNIIDSLFFMFWYSVPTLSTIIKATNILRLCRFCITSTPFVFAE